jgi:hypothetical protein
MSEAIASKAERLAAYNANIAAAEKDPSLSPETGKPLSKMNAARFGAGFLVFGVLWMSGLGIVSAVLLPMHYKTIPGVNADALVGIVNAFTAVASLVANPIAPVPASAAVPRGSSSEPCSVASPCS